MNADVNQDCKVKGELFTEYGISNLRDYYREWKKNNIITQWLKSYIYQYGQFNAESKATTTTEE